MTDPELHKAVRAQDAASVKDHLPYAPEDITGEAFLLAIAYGNEPMALDILRDEHGDMPTGLVEEALRDATAHHEPRLVQALIDQYRSQLSTEAWLDALLLALEGEYADILDLLLEEGIFEDIINTQSDQHPHPIVSAIKSGNAWMLQKLIDYPQIDIDYEHLKLAQELLQKQQSKAQAHAKTREIERAETIDQRLNLIQHEKYQAVVGPHVNIEKIRRRREARLTRGL